MANPHYRHAPASYAAPPSAPAPRGPPPGPYGGSVPGPMPAPASYGAPPPPAMTGGRVDPATQNRKLFIGGIAPDGSIDVETIRYDFGKIGEIEDCFVPADRNMPGRIRGIAFVTYREESTAREAIAQMHNRNYHGREISVNLAKPREPDPKKDGSFHTADKYQGKYDAGGKLRPEFRGTTEDPDYAGPNYNPRYDRDDGRTDAERERDYRRDSHTSGNSYDGTGKYGDRDPRPKQTYYD